MLVKSVNKIYGLRSVVSWHDIALSFASAVSATQPPPCAIKLTKYELTKIKCFIVAP